MELFKKETPLNCEIDAYGDFLQALGPKATAAYTKDTKNVSTIADNLVKMREKIYHLLKDTPLTIIALNKSAFYHFGTIAECLDHFCEGDVLGRQMDFKKWVSSRIISENGDDEGPTKAKKAKIEDKFKHFSGCVMTSALHKSSNVHNRCIVEYCHFEVPVDVGCNSLVSNCEILAKDANQGQKLIFPADAFIHTVPVIHEDQTKYVTVYLPVTII